MEVLSCIRQPLWVQRTNIADDYKNIKFVHRMYKFALLR